MSSFEVLLFDAGACQWRCGRAEEQGPDVVLPGVAAGDTEAWQHQFKAALEQLEADPTECALILSEPPATTAAQRAERASFLFALGLQSVHFAAAPLLAIYDAGFDTGMVVDVGLRAAYIYALVDGLSVLEKATVVRLPSSGEERAWPDCEDHLPLLLDALVRTLALIDTSLREQLLATITLVGGGSFAPELPQRLEQQLRDALKPAPWAVRIVAGKQRRFQPSPLP